MSLLNLVPHAAFGNQAPVNLVITKLHAKGLARRARGTVSKPTRPGSGALLYNSEWWKQYQLDSNT